MSVHVVTSLVPVIIIIAADHMTYSQSHTVKISQILHIFSVQ